MNNRSPEVSIETTQEDAQALGREQLASLRQELSEGNVERFDDVLANLRNQADGSVAEAQQYLIRNDHLVKQLRVSADITSELTRLNEDFAAALTNLKTKQSATPPAQTMSSPTQVLVNAPVLTQDDINTFNQQKEQYVEGVKQIVEQIMTARAEESKNRLKVTKEKQAEANRQELELRKQHKAEKIKLNALNTELTNIGRQITSLQAKTDRTAAEETLLEEYTTLQEELTNDKEPNEAIVKLLQAQHQEKIVLQANTAIELAKQTVINNVDKANLKTVKRGGTEIKQHKEAAQFDSSINLGFTEQKGNLQRTVTRAEKQALNADYQNAKRAWRTELQRYTTDLSDLQADNSFDQFLNFQLADVDMSTIETYLDAYEAEQANLNQLTTEYVRERLNSRLSDSEKYTAQGVQLVANALLNSSAQTIDSIEGLSDNPENNINLENEGRIDFGLGVFGSMRVPENIGDQGLATRAFKNGQLVNTSRTPNLKANDEIVFDFVHEPVTVNTQIDGENHTYARVRSINGRMVSGQNLYVSTRHLRQDLDRGQYQESLQTSAQETIEQAQTEINTITRFYNSQELEDYVILMSAQSMPDLGNVSQFIQNAIPAHLAIKETHADNVDVLESIEGDLNQIKSNPEESASHTIAQVELDKITQLKRTDITTLNDLISENETYLDQLRRAETFKTALDAIAKPTEITRKVTGDVYDLMSLPGAEDYDISELPGKSETETLQAYRDQLSFLGVHLAFRNGQSILTDNERYANAVKALPSFEEVYDTFPDFRNRIDSQNTLIENLKTNLTSVTNEQNMIRENIELVRSSYHLHKLGLTPTEAMITALSDNEMTNSSENTIKLRGATLDLSKVPANRVNSSIINDTTIYIEWNNGYVEDAEIHLIKSNNNWIAGGDHDDETNIVTF